MNIAEFLLSDGVIEQRGRLGDVELTYNPWDQAKELRDRGLELPGQSELFEITQQYDFSALGLELIEEALPQEGEILGLPVLSERSVDRFVAGLREVSLEKFFQSLNGTDWFLELLPLANRAAVLIPNDRVLETARIETLQQVVLEPGEVALHRVGVGMVREGRFELISEQEDTSKCGPGRRGEGEDAEAFCRNIGCGGPCDGLWVRDPHTGRPRLVSCSCRF